MNCAAIPNELIESELFGHEKGAFTGAHARHHGYVERARNGFLFLDEVGELPMPVQAKLLRLVEERAFTRIGGETAYQGMRAHRLRHERRPGRAVAEGRFRRDLYYRINVIPITVPALRHRPDDVLPLAYAFVREFSEAFGREVHGFTATAEQACWRRRGRVMSASSEIASSAPLLSANRLGLVLKPSFPRKQWIRLGLRTDCQLSLKRARGGTKAHPYRARTGPR